MSLDIKICGLKTDDALDAALVGGATHVGFIFFEKSPRNVDTETAGRLSRAARRRLSIPVAVTVDADDATLARIVADVEPGMLQLHGRETPERVAEIRAKLGLPVMKALAIREAGDLAKAGPYMGVADRLLFDAKAPEGSERPGGNGVPFDWSLLSSLDPGFDYILSGGLDATNIGQALSLARPAGIDVSSGVESAPGVKDTSLIAGFFARVREAAGVATA